MSKRDVVRMSKIRKLWLAKNAFSFKKYIVYVRVGKEMDAWLCEFDSSVCVMKAEGVEAAPLLLQKSDVHVEDYFFELVWSVVEEQNVSEMPLFANPLVVGMSKNKLFFFFSFFFFFFKGSNESVVSKVIKTLPNAKSFVMKCHLDEISLNLLTVNVIAIDPKGGV
jgi:hypothetical protein